MKTLRILAMLCIMLGITVSAKSPGNQVERPLKGAFYSIVIGSAGPIETLSINGIASHLGIVRNCEMTLDKGNHFAMSGFIRAANGDYFIFSCVPILVMTGPGRSGTMSGTVYIAGGTGRFTGCCGEAEMTGTFNMDEDWARWTIDGTITY
jgi:hypothetical protein